MIRQESRETLSLILPRYGTNISCILAKDLFGEVYRILVHAFLHQVTIIVDNSSHETSVFFLDLLNVILQLLSEIFNLISVAMSHLVPYRS